MPSWSKKEREIFEGARETYEALGRSEGRAEALAARMVNRPRRTGRDAGDREESLEARTKQELYDRAREMQIEGRSRMDKQELIQAIRQEEGGTRG